MELQNAWEVVKKYGEYMEKSKVVHIGFDNDLPFSKSEILLAIWTVITEENFSVIENAESIKNSLYIALADLLKHCPRPENYLELVEYQKTFDTSNS